MEMKFSFRLADDAVDIWAFPTIASDVVIARLETVLNRDELQRAACFRFPHLRRSFVLARGTLRCLLGRYLQSDPGAVRFVYCTNGKPEVVSTTGLRFNMTHSGRLAMIAMTAECDIGVDLEVIRQLSEFQCLADRFFCPEESSAIRSCPEGEREAAFFCCWTRKEAYLKATGRGLSAPLNQFCVSAHSDGPSRFINTEGDTEQDWIIESLRLRPGYAAAIAYRSSTPRQIHICDDPPSYIQIP
jgi:4'-phosphopantetheinyl transferase